MRRRRSHDPSTGEQLPCPSGVLSSLPFYGVSHLVVPKPNLGVLVEEAHDVVEEGF